MDRQSQEGREELRRLSYLPTQLPRPSVGLLHFRIPIALDVLQSPAQESVEGEFVLQTRRGIRKRLQHFQSLGEVTYGLSIGRTLAGSLARPLPVLHGLLAETRLGVVMRHQLRLRLRNVGKPRFQHLRDALVVLLPGAPQQ